jgi:uncharacterized protein involved in exopolysaccharide biosynthesis
MERSVDVAGRLKQARFDAVVTVLEEQLESSELELEQAERDLGDYLVGTIRASSGRSSPPDDEAHTTEARLSRRVQVTESLYSELRRRLETARIAAASASPDLRVLARASVLDRANRDDGLPIAAMILLACLAVGLGGGFLVVRSAVIASEEL